MKDTDIECPKCGEKFKIGQDVIARSVRENIENELKKKMETDYKNQLDLEKNKIIEQLSEDQDKELAVLKNELSDKAKKINEFREAELKLIQEKNKLEEAKKDIELETRRRLEEEKKLIEERVTKQAEQEFQFKLLEKEKQLEDQKKLISEMQRKAQQGSMQTQGEVMELALRDTLKKRFANDEIEDVPKGVSGADIIQKVMAANNEVAGIIAWESKQTKAWTEDWVNKLKDDGHRVKANLLVLVSNVLPKEIDRFGPYKGIWVTDYESAMGMAGALRNNLLSVYSVALANENSQDKAAVLYKHLTSQAFINRVQSISETHIGMLTDLAKEKLAMERIWVSREKQIERLGANTRQVFNEIGGIVGGQYSGIEILDELANKELTEPKKKTKNIIDDTQANLF